MDGNNEQGPVQPPLQSVEKHVKPKRNGWLRRVTGSTSLYGLELILSTIGLFVTAAVLTYGVYVLFNYLQGMDESSMRQFVGEFSIWLVAAMIVWLPLALFFYVRTRAEVSKNPAREQTLLHKLIVGSFRFTLIIAIVSILFSVVYAAIRAMIGIDDSLKDVAMRVIIPGLVAAVINTGIVMAYHRSEKPSRWVFVTGLGIVSVGIMIAILVVSVGSVRNDALDSRAASDLSSIENEVGSYYGQNQKTPDRLAQLSGLKQEVRDRLEKYSYTRVDDTKYKICATFLTDTTSNNYAVPVKSSGESDYSQYVNFYGHAKGEQCYKVATTYAYDATYKLYDGSTTSPSLPQSTTLY